MTISDFTSIWKECSAVVANSPAEQKRKALSLLKLKWKDLVLHDNDLNAAIAEALDWLKNLDELPLSISRGQIADIPPVPSKLRGAISSTSDWIWRMITVKASDCDICSGEDRVYLWSSGTQEVVTCCDLCPGTYDLKGRKGVKECRDKPVWDRECKFLTKKV